MFVYRIEVADFDENDEDTTRCYTQSFPSHEAADWWASNNPHYVTMEFLMEVERNEKDHLVEV